jgi:hypothetical protein
MLALFGYIVKSIVLFAVGGFFGYYYSEEKEPLKLIQLGLAVPALLLSIANGSNVPTAKIGDPKNSEVRQSNVLTIDAAVYAAEDAGTGSKPAKMPGIKRFTLPSLSPFQQFWQGVTSRPLERVWFVIAADDLDLESAKKTVEDLKSKHPELQPELFYKFGDDHRYAVVIGKHMEYEDAVKLRNKARTSEDLKSAFIWSLPSSQGKPAAGSN